MPIIGLTTQTQAGAGLPTIARLYKGSEKQVIERGGRQVETTGRDLDYFRAEFEPQFAHLAPLWVEMYGSEPREFAPVFLAASTVAEAFATWKEEWGGAGTLLHRCDGKEQVRRWDAAAGAYSSEPTACAAPQCGCKAVGRLSIVLPDFVQESGVLGYVSIVTHAINDILTVYRYLSDIQRLYGRLTGVPFVFGRAAKEVSVPKQVKRDGGYVVEGRMKTTKSLFYIHVAPEFARQQMLLPLTETVAALPSRAVETVDAETGEIVSANEPAPAALVPKRQNDWTAFWTAWRDAGFALGDKESMQTVLGVGSTYGQDPAVMLERLETYLKAQQEGRAYEPG